MLQKQKLIELMAKKGKNILDIYRALEPFQRIRPEIQRIQDLNINEANVLLDKLESLPDKVKQEKLL